MRHNLLATTLESVTIGSPVIVDNLAMIPLIANAPATGSAYSLLDAALASGVTEITEVSEAGVVPELRVLNRGDHRVLIVDGEELIGAKQNRVVNLSILVAAQSELTIPVSCVEAGRWRARSRSFTSSPRTQYASGRAKRMTHVSYAMSMTGDRRSNQADVWDDIAEKSLRLQAASPTSAMEAIFTTHERMVDEFVDGIRAVDGQVGAMFAIDGRIVGFDLFDRPSTLARMLPKLVRSAAIDAIDAAGARRRGAACDASGTFADLTTQASRFLGVTAKIDPDVHPAVGLGEDARLSAPHLTGAALLVDDSVLHFGAFAL